MCMYNYIHTHFFKVRNCDQCFNSGPKNILVLFLSYTFLAVGAGTSWAVSQGLRWILEQVLRVGRKLELQTMAVDKAGRW